MMRYYYCNIYSLISVRSSIYPYTRKPTTQEYIFSKTIPKYPANQKYFTLKVLVLTQLFAVLNTLEIQMAVPYRDLLLNLNLIL